MFFRKTILFPVILGLFSLFAEENIPLPEEPTLTELKDTDSPLGFDITAFLEKKPSFAKEEMPKEGYTINYDAVSMIEYVKFASKICGTNFLFNEEDLNFTVTVVSDAPVTKENVMSTLIQMLRIHGLTLLEEENNLVIHKSDGVNQIAKLVTEPGQEKGFPIVTRIFRTKNTKVESVAAVIQPMISTSAILETSPDTRQLILTDVTSNVDKVASLIEILDSPHTPLTIQSFESLHNSPEFLIEIASQIMAPITEGYPFILVPQSLANTIFIVSTPELVDQARSVLSTLDMPPKKDQLLRRKLRGENVLIYKVENTSGMTILSGLNTIAENLLKAGSPESELINSIESGKWIQETNSLMFVGSKETLAKIHEFLLALDAATDGLSGKEDFFIFRPQYRSAGDVEKAILEMSSNLKSASTKDEAFLRAMDSVKVNPMTNTLIFSGDPSTFPRIKELLTTIDNAASDQEFSAQTTFYLYKIEHAEPEEIMSGLKNFAQNLDESRAVDQGLVKAIHSQKYIEEISSILFTGPDYALKRLQEIVPNFDSRIGSTVGDQFYIYKSKNIRGDLLYQSLKEIAARLKSEEFGDPSLIRSLDSMQWVKSSHSLLFTGDSSSIKKLEELIATIDTPGSQPQGREKTFFLYQPVHASKYKTEMYLQELSSNLNKKEERDLIQTIHSMKWIEPSHSFLFHGSTASMQKLQELLKEFDNPLSLSASAHKQFFIYPLQHVSEKRMDEYLSQVTANLKKNGGDPDLIYAIQSRKWIQDSTSFMFQGTESALEQLKEVVKTFDTVVDIPQKQRSSYFLYKVQHTTGDLIEEDLETLLKDFKSSGYENKKVLHVLEHVRYIKETNALLLTGDPQGVEEVKKIIEEYDYPREKGPDTSKFFMYKPHHLPAKDIEKSLKEVGENLKKADLADPNLLGAIHSVKYVEATNALLFTGSADALTKIEGLIKDIDVPPKQKTPIQKVGQTTFLLYKLKYASGSDIVSSIKTMTCNLKKSGDVDASFIAALQTMKYVKETNSLLFTGSEGSLEKVKDLVEQFDVTNLSSSKTKASASGASNFFVYQPQSLSGPEIERILEEFSENLKMGGLRDPDLFHAIDSGRYIDKTRSLVFTGTPKALDQIKELLKTFDVPANLPAGPLPGGSLEPSIQAIDNTSFLVYKLQYHKGDEIQGALRQIAKDLILSNAPVNQNLLNSINSIQWLEVTNSLLCSGDQETLTRLRELIKNLDIPLKQVFIEMLVIETSLTNALSFGLEWGGNYKYRNKFGGSSYNTNPLTNVQDGSSVTTSSDNFIQGLSKQDPTASGSTISPINNTALSTVSNKIPPSSGFDLGVIGQVIKHNGNTFLTLGSLLSALQTDDQTSILMTPKILAQDGRTSKIFVGRNIPFFGSFVNNQGANSLQTTNIEYRDVGVNLTVTPVLGNSEVITLDIALEKTQQLTDVTSSTITINQSSATAPTTSKTTMETTVHVPDRSFLVLSGFADSSSVKAKAGIPCLGGLPVIGAAFSRGDETVSQNNIVIFLRPHIITSVDDIKKVSEDQEDFFRDQAGTPYLEKHFDEAMEMIKSVDDE